MKPAGSDVGEKGGWEGVVGSDGEGEDGCDEREGGDNSDAAAAIEGPPADPYSTSAVLGVCW